MDELTINRFRRARGRILRKKIDRISELLGRAINVIDVGGRTEYWENVGLKNIESITVLNYDESEIEHRGCDVIFEFHVGDARSMKQFKDKSFDLVHSNSVIEHVGAWRDMEAMAHEVQRIGRHGWIQTPAWEFPIEPHFKAPFLHWFGQPLRRQMMFMSPSYRGKSLPEKRYHVDRINLLSRAEFKNLFRDREILVERFMTLPKSYVCIW